MNLKELPARILHLCEYVLCGVESEELRRKYNEMCKAWARCLELKKEIEQIISKYE